MHHSQSVSEHHLESLFHLRKRDLVPRHLREVIGGEREESLEVVDSAVAR